MKKALLLAAHGWPDVAPNPMVGCVIVRDDVIVSEGYHRFFGGPHAEVEAVRNLPVEVSPEDCTVYVTLEPCSHFGKTPPCANLIIDKGFKKVIVCNVDPNPLVAGTGIKKMREAGIEVITGILEEEGRELNKRFFTFHNKKRPYIILKWAETADGFISKWPVPEKREDNMIGDKAQQTAVHFLRASEMAIMVGKNTVLADNPQLTVRLVKGKNPLRVLIDKNLEVPSNAKIFNQEANTLVFNSKLDKIEGNIEHCRINFDENTIQQMLHSLFQRNIQSLIVEGGRFTLQQFLDAGLCDELKRYVNKDLYFSNGIKAPKLGSLYQDR